MRDFNWIWKLALVTLIAWVVISQSVRFGDITSGAAEVLEKVKR